MMGVASEEVEEVYTSKSDVTVEMRPWKQSSEGPKQDISSLFQLLSGYIKLLTIRENETAPTDCTASINLRSFC